MLNRGMLCGSCKTDLPESEFNWKNRSLNKRSSVCKSCHRVYQTRYYIKHRDVVIANSKQHTKFKRDKFRLWKSTLSCCLCGESDEVCLDFHHVDPTQKEYDITALASSNQSAAKLSEELKKCVVACRNCHAKIHKYKLHIPDVGVIFNGWDRAA